MLQCTIVVLQCTIVTMQRPEVGCNDPLLSCNAACQGCNDQYPVTMSHNRTATIHISLVAEQKIGATVRGNQEPEQCHPAMTEIQPDMLRCSETTTDECFPTVRSSEVMHSGCRAMYYCRDAFVHCIRLQWKIETGKKPFHYFIALSFTSIPT
jgi:hypothetical protein